MFANWYAEVNLFSLATLSPVSAQRNTICNMYIYICIFLSLYCATQRNTVCIAQFDDKITIILVQFIDYESCRTYEWPHLSTINTFIDSIHDTRHLKICMSVLHNSKAKSQSFSRNSYFVNSHRLCVAECCRVLQSVAECCRVLQSVAVSTATVRQGSLCLCVAVCCSVLPQSQHSRCQTRIFMSVLQQHKKNGILTKKMAFSQNKWHSHKRNGILTQKMAFS